MRTVLLAGVVTALVLCCLRFAADPAPARSLTGPTTVPTTTPTTPPAPATTTTAATPTAKRVYASSADLPDGEPFPLHGAGTFHVVPGTSPVVGSGPVRTYAVEVEDGVQVDEQAFAAFVQETLSDPRGWTARGDVAFQRVSGAAAIRVRLTSQGTARAVCGFGIPVDVSCRDGGLVHLSAARWVRGAVAFGGDLVAYRRYVVNHEVGHVLGKGHRPCEQDGAPAPVMMQQTFSTSNDEIVRITAGVPQGAVIPADGKVCRPNGTPFP